MVIYSRSAKSWRNAGPIFWAQTCTQKPRGAPRCRHVTILASHRTNNSVCLGLSDFVGVKSPENHVFIRSSRVDRPWIEPKVEISRVCVAGSQCKGRGKPK